MIAMVLFCHDNILTRYFFLCQALIILGSFLFDKVLPMKIRLWCRQWELGFDVTNKNWAFMLPMGIGLSCYQWELGFDIANKNWALMLPMRIGYLILPMKIGFWMNESPWVWIMGFDYGFEFHLIKLFCYRLESWAFQIFSSISILGL